MEIYNMNLIMRKHQTSKNRENLYKITGQCHLKMSNSDKIGLRNVLEYGKLRSHDN